jgi:NAD(P)H-dependent flavin oxidoreductase YrpB (nitropropane dioxygenase family)
MAALRFRKETGTSLGDLLREGRSMRKNQDLALSQLAMAANAPMLIKATMVDGKPEVGILPTGQVTGVIDELPAVAELLDRIESEADAVLKRLGDGR